MIRSSIPRTAIVTGGGKRVGAVITQALLDDGWTVVAHVRRIDDPVPEGAIRAAADLTQADCADRIFAATTGQPPVRLLVNNASRFAVDSIDHPDPDEFITQMTTNVRAPALLSAAFAASTEGGEGDRLVVNILDAKLAAPNPDFASYTLSKFALAGLTEISARAFAERGIRVNGIAPALMLRSGDQTERNFEAAHQYNPLKRGIDPDDVVSALRFLIAAPGVTGQVMTLDAGQRFMGLPRDVQFLEIE